MVRSEHRRRAATARSGCCKDDLRRAKGVQLKWHDPEGDPRRRVIASRGDRRLGPGHRRRVAPGRYVPGVVGALQTTTCGWRRWPPTTVDVDWYVHRHRSDDEVLPWESPLGGPAPGFSCGRTGAMPSSTSASRTAGGHRATTAARAPATGSSTWWPRPPRPRGGSQGTGVDARVRLVRRSRCHPAESDQRWGPAHHEAAGPASPSTARSGSPRIATWPGSGNVWCGATQLPGGLLRGIQPSGPSCRSVSPSPPDTSPRRSTSTSTWCPQRADEVDVGVAPRSCSVPSCCREGMTASAVGRSPTDGGRPCSRQSPVAPGSIDVADIGSVDTCWARGRRARALAADSRDRRHPSAQGQGGHRRPPTPRAQPRRPIRADRSTWTGNETRKADRRARNATACGATLRAPGSPRPAAHRAPGPPTSHNGSTTDDRPAQRASLTCRGVGRQHPRGAT